MSNAPTLDFKIWDKFNKQWLQPMGVLFGHDNTIWRVTARKEGENALDDGWYDIEGADLEQIVFCWFTGMKDRNERKIYAGDVIEWTSSNPFSLGEVRRVCVEYAQAQFWCRGDIGVYLAELLSHEKCRSIGNIHENPELIRKTEKA